MITSFLTIDDLALAASMGADIKSRTFVYTADIPHAWFNELRRLGFTPIEPPPPATAPKEASADEAYAAEIEALPPERFNALRAAGWAPGQPIPPETEEAE